MGASVNVNMTSPDVIPGISLNSGVDIPQIGFGVWQIPNDDAQAAVSDALRTGYRSIDTAKVYDNEVGTGRGIAESGVSRDEVYLATKLWNADQGYDETLRAFDASVERLGVDYVDLYLIHWPLPERDRFTDTFKAFQRIRDEGRATSIGVSNFRIEDLEKIMDETGEVPAVNQIELHPGFTQPELREFHAKHGIATEAWSPLGQGKSLGDRVITSIAEKNSVTPAQVILRWHIQLGNVVIPKSVTSTRIAENFDIFRFELSREEIERISAIPGERIGGHPSDPWRE